MQPGVVGGQPARRRRAAQRRGAPRRGAGLLGVAGVCVCVCARARVREFLNACACVRACVRARVRACVRMWRVRLRARVCDAPPMLANKGAPPPGPVLRRRGMAAPRLAGAVRGAGGAAPCLGFAAAAGRMGRWSKTKDASIDWRPLAVWGPGSPGTGRRALTLARARRGAARQAVGGMDLHA